MAESEPYQPEPIAIVGFACRLPGGNYSPHKLWDFLERGEIAWNGVPPSRFNIAGHYDGSLKPKTMRQPGGMFLKDIDLADFDAGFFELGTSDVIAMDPNQRQILEVVYEGFENAGIPMEKIDNKVVGCYMGSYGADYADMANRNPEDRPFGNVLGIARRILSNRISHFFNLKGPSITVDTACSGSLVGLDMACQNLRARTIDMGIVASSNLYMSPEHLIDAGNVGGAHSPTALCHTFDAKADGYVKAEAVSTAIVKRLSDAIRDGDPIRGVVLGTATHHNGRTAGIASPNAESQALAIRAAYANAGITDFNQTTFLECHGTGTQAGDANEVQGITSVFSASRPEDKPLIIGSIKSNVGHAEPAAGLSGLMKAAMSIEKGIVPGNPTFITPSPKIDFAGAKVRVSRNLIVWPENAPRRASINSFGIGGSNAHAIIQQAPQRDNVRHVSSYSEVPGDFSMEEDEAAAPYSLVLSANDAATLKANIKALCTHLINPRVKRRSRLFHRAFSDFVLGKKAPEALKIGFVFTGQGTQWPQMGRDILEFFPWTRTILEELDQVLQAQKDPPNWSLISELSEPRSAKHMRQPEISQPLVTALQLCLVAVLESWGIKAICVVGHSSGECAAAYVAGWVDRAGALKAAFYRGRAALIRQAETLKDIGMLAVGMGADAIQPYLEKHIGDASIACFNSPSSLTLSGKMSALDAIAEEVKADGHFARLLLVDLAYHSKFMGVIRDEYNSLLDTDGKFNVIEHSSSTATMYSSVTGLKKDTPADPLYWKTNMVSPVNFDDALKEMVVKESPTLLIEVGPSGALAGPVGQVLKALSKANDVSYQAAWARGASAGNALYDIAGRLFTNGHPIDLTVVNKYSDTAKTIIDLPNYVWNHSVKYWHESPASKDWRFRQFPVHDLLGSKVLGAPWHNPVWRHLLNVANVPWILDHRMGGDAIMPGAGFLTLGLEALFQEHCALNHKEAPASANELAYRFRNVRFNQALVLEPGKDMPLMLTLTKVPGSNSEWHEFRVSTTQAEAEVEHCVGLVRIQDPVDEVLEDITPLKMPQPASKWYKVEAEIGLDFGPAFQKLISIEAVSGQRTCRTLMSMAPPVSKWEPQSYYPIHPSSFDGCIQTPIPANAGGERVGVKDVMIPAMFDDVLVNKVPYHLNEAYSFAKSIYSGRGRPDQDKSWKAYSSVYDSVTGALLLDVPPKPDVHTFDRVAWEPDISLLSQDQMIRVIDLIAYKRPDLKVLEVNLDEADTSCLTAYAQYVFASSDGRTITSVQTKYEDMENTNFLFVHPEKDGFGFNAEIACDLAINKFSRRTESSIEGVVRNLQTLLEADSHTIVIPTRIVSGAQSASGLDDSTGSEEYVNLDQNSPALESPARSSASEADSPSSSVDSVAWDQRIAERSLSQGKGGTSWQSLSRSTNHSPILEIAASDDGRPAYLLRNTIEAESKQQPPRNLLVASLSGRNRPSLGPSLQATLEKAGWIVIQQTIPFPKPKPGTIVLVLDELSTSILKHVKEKQWEAIKTLITSGYLDTDPDKALIQGLFRVAHAEDHSTKLTTLDVQSSMSRVTEWAIDHVLRLLASAETGGPRAETQYMERDGVLQIQRLVPDTAVNDLKRAEVDGHAPTIKPLRTSEAQVALRTERLGTLQSLQWCETDVGDATPVAPGSLEVDVMAAGVNYKDVAISMAIVADNEYAMGLECGGVIRRLGPGVDKFRVGDRVCLLKAGSYANRVLTEAGRCHAIPDSMSFEEAATIPFVYLCSLYGFVLIHSATGGVGIACLELARFKKAEIWVTVGTEEKRQFLENNYSIPRSHMFSSRSTLFAGEIMSATDGRGVDAVVNSLTGELLDASWRILADGGTMVEIGKKDILDRNTLAMEPFDRNCSFRAVDLSYTKHMDEHMISGLFREVFDLINSGHIKPIHPITTFGFDAIPAALAHIRAGKHIGKIVISDQQKEDGDVSYLIVGGLKGACGTLAVHMAQHGARHLVVSNRSGINDITSSQVVKDCAFYGCEIVESRGDVGDYTSVKRVFESITPGIAGIIQGAMLLRDKPFENMTVDDFHTTIHAKVQGTWNLHRASLEQLKQPLNFFTMLSSISGLVGRRGQANYAAGNTFLDAFASYRQSQGLCANSVDLGMIVDVGHIADDEKGLEDRFDKTRWIPINENMLRRVLTYSILQQDPTAQLNPNKSVQLVTGIAHPLVRDDEGEIDYDARFSYLYAARNGAHGAGLGSGGGPGASGSSDKSDQAVKTLQVMQSSGADASALVKPTVEALSGQFTKILQLDDEVEPGKSLMAYGLDSLSAIELRNWTRQKIGVELTTLDIINATSMITLSEKVVSKLTQADDTKK
ncbi:beta-ketoacyl synthase domain-containing protein [Xylariales sp. AK1849]|nr:beta-ketoacyl synthase domain-containing protein [Xylariales sp. AK1849]